MMSVYWAPPTKLDPAVITIYHSVLLVTNSLEMCHSLRVLPGIFLTLIQTALYSQFPIQVPRLGVFCMCAFKMLLFDKLAFYLFSFHTGQLFYLLVSHFLALKHFVMGSFSFPTLLKEQ